jgi:hypothetical protein
MKVGSKRGGVLESQEGSSLFDFNSLNSQDSIDERPLDLKIISWLTEKGIRKGDPQLFSTTITPSRSRAYTRRRS